MDTIRVLVADDDQSVRTAVERLMSSCGYTVETAGNYCDVKDLLDANAYALIVCDNGMPLSPGSMKIDRTCGLQLLAHAKAHGHNKETPFVLNTGDDTEEIRRIAKELGGIYRFKLDTVVPLADLAAQLLKQ